MKMRFYCQLAFATARLPCIQIRLPSRGRTERDWLQTKLSFVTKWLRLKESTWFASREVMPIGFFARSLQDCKGTDRLLESPKTRSEPLVLHTTNTVLCKQSRADGYWPYWPREARTTENKGALSQELMGLQFSRRRASCSLQRSRQCLENSCRTQLAVLATLVSRVAVPPFHPSKTFSVIARSNAGSFPWTCMCLRHIPGVTKQELNPLCFANWCLETSCSLWATPHFPGTFTLPCLSLSFYLYLHIHIHTTGAHVCTHTRCLFIMDNFKYTK